MRSKRKLIALSNVLPGHRFEHYRALYVRATDAETRHHPGQELAEQRGQGKVILAYTQGKGSSRTPVSFNAGVKVVVTEVRR